MSAIIRVIPDKDYEVIRQYLEDGVILIPESVAQRQFGEAVEDVEGLELIEYNFGGEPDVWADLVSSENHFALTSIHEALQKKTAEDDEREEA